MSPLHTFILFTVGLVVIVAGQDSNATTTTVKTTTTTSASTTTPTIQEACAALNASCDTCLENPKCLFCFEPKKCVPYPVSQVIPHSDVCDLGKARWGTCLVNYKILLICMGVVGGVIFLTIFCCCVYCCCCRGNGKARRKYMADEAKWEQDRVDRKSRNDERRAERQSKLDDIRRKYGGARSEETEGLMKDDTPYQRFEES